MITSFFIVVSKENNKDQHNKSDHELIRIDATEQVVKGRASSLQVNVLSTSLDCDSNVSRCNNHSARCCLSELKSYASRGPDIVGTSTSNNCRDNTQFNFLSDVRDFFIYLYILLVNIQIIVKSKCIAESAYWYHFRWWWWW